MVDPVPNHPIRLTRIEGVIVGGEEMEEEKTVVIMIAVGGKT